MDLHAKSLMDLANQQADEITVETKEGEGNIFWFTLQADAQAV